MSAPLAYFLSWTCYGQRLHGDERGSVDRKHASPGTPLLPHQPDREWHKHRIMSGEAVLLSPPMREVVDAAIVELCSARGWLLLARNVRSTHAHVVVRVVARVTPERVLADLKARATRELRRTRLVTDKARLWAHHGSTRWINHWPGLYGAIIYVNDWQSGPNRRLIEAHRRLLRAQVARVRAHVRECG